MAGKTDRETDVLKRQFVTAWNLTMRAGLGIAEATDAAAHAVAVLAAERNRHADELLDDAYDLLDDATCKLLDPSHRRGWGQRRRRFKDAVLARKHG